MRILHAVHKGLPDWRIEREAYLAKKAGHHVEFLGLGEKREPFLDVFSQVTMLRSINNRQAVLDKSIRREWSDAIDRINPDLVHANDIIAAEFSSGLDVPMVYDDREYWTMQRIMYKSWPLWKRIAIRPFLRVIPVWEKEILSKHVTVTVTEAIAEEHRMHCANVFVLRNLSLGEEVRGLDVNPTREGIVYLGSDFTRARFAPHRDMKGLTEHICFDTVTGLPRDEMYRTLTKYRIGLVPFRTTPYTKYIGATKTYDYLNSGLQVLMTRPLYKSHEKLPYTYPFDDYSELPSMIDSLEHVNPKEIMEYSHENLVWEAQQNTLFRAYDVCLDKGQ